jgi:glycosyltransferase involved in cell wall biosynthesis
MEHSRPRLLQIAPRFCGDPTAGAELRNFHLAARLALHMDVTHLGFLPAGAPAVAVPTAEGETSNLRFYPVPREGAYRLRDLFHGVAGSVPFSVLNYTRPAMREVLRGLLYRESFDFILLEGVHLGEYLPLLRCGKSRPLVMCDWHNIESEILRRYSQTAVGWTRRRYARLAAGKLEAYESRFVNQCDLHSVVSERDRQTLIGYGSRVPVITVENGVAVEQFTSRPGGSDPRKRRFRVIFTGAMDYHANVAAVRWFAREVWPHVRAATPGFVFTIVGRNPAPDVRALGSEPGIEVTGMVPDVRPYYAQAIAAVMPLRVGGGTRIKILEAMAAGVPVISTGPGAEGLAAIPGTHFTQADSGAQMIEALRNLVEKPGTLAAMTAAAYEFVREHHDWELLGDRLAHELMTLRGGHLRAAATV